MAVSISFLDDVGREDDMLSIICAGRLNARYSAINPDPQPSIKPYIDCVMDPDDDMDSRR